MNDNPWWLWKGAAVRLPNQHNRLVEVTQVNGDIQVEGYAHWPLGSSTDEITPIENPAVMLAPEWATHVHIRHPDGKVVYMDDPYDITAWWARHRDDGWFTFTWPQCPESLKGRTWTLPRRDV